VKRTIGVWPGLGMLTRVAHLLTPRQEALVEFGKADGV
jgi:hypothetical protein